MLKDFAIEHFDPTQGHVVSSEDESRSKMQVREQENLRWLVGHDGLLHSIMWLDQPHYPLMPHVQSMLLAFLVMPQAQNALTLGLGSGSIERCCSRQFPDVALTTVEISAAIYQQVARHFPLPPDLNIVIDDARHYLATHTAAHDIILCDIFDTDANKNTIYSDSFIALLFDRLSDDGVLAINFVGSAEDELIRVLLALRRIFQCTALLQIENHLNIVILAAKTYRSVADIHAAAAKLQSAPSPLDWEATVAAFDWLPAPDKQPHS